jgi:hypothetical protein
MSTQHDGGFVDVKPSGGTAAILLLYRSPQNQQRHRIYRHVDLDQTYTS